MKVGKCAELGRAAAESMAQPSDLLCVPQTAASSPMAYAVKVSVQQASASRADCMYGFAVFEMVPFIGFESVDVLPCSF